MAVPLPEASWNGAGGLVASPLSTVLVFAASSGELTFCRSAQLLPCRIVALFCCCMPSKQVCRRWCHRVTLIELNLLHGKDAACLVIQKLDHLLSRPFVARVPCFNRLKMSNQLRVYPLCRAGLTKAQLQAAFGIDAAIDISTFNALADALNKGASGPGLTVLKVLFPPFCVHF